MTNKAKLISDKLNMVYRWLNPVVPVSKIGRQGAL